MHWPREIFGIKYRPPTAPAFPLSPPPTRFDPPKFINIATSVVTRLTVGAQLKMGAEEFIRKHHQSRTENVQYKKLALAITSARVGRLNGHKTETLAASANFKFWVSLNPYPFVHSAWKDRKKSRIWNRTKSEKRASKNIHKTVPEKTSRSALSYLCPFIMKPLRSLSDLNSTERSIRFECIQVPKNFEKRIAES